MVKIYVHRTGDVIYLKYGSNRKYDETALTQVEVAQNYAKDFQNDESVTGIIPSLTKAVITICHSTKEEISLHF
jgi:hypothetical protein